MNIETNIGVDTVSVGIPEGLSPEAVRARKAALIAAGTEPLLAEKFAIDAEQQQVMRDKHLAAEVVEKEVVLTAKVPVAKTHPDADKQKGAK